MTEMELRNSAMAFESSADRALREEIMSCRDKYFVLNGMRPTWIAERESFLSQMFGAFRG